MISYERSDKSEGIHFNKGENSIKCVIFDYYYQSYVCNACHDFSMTVQKLSDFFILTIKPESILQTLIKKQQ